MQHSIRYHSRLSHFLVTVEETVNHDFDLEDQTPLAEIWSSQKLNRDDIQKLDFLSHGAIWELNREDENLIPEIVSSGVHMWNGRLVIVGEFDGEVGPSLYFWEFCKRC